MYLYGRWNTTVLVMVDGMVTVVAPALLFKDAVQNLLNCMADGMAWMWQMEWQLIIKVFYVMFLGVKQNFTLDMWQIVVINVTAEGWIIHLYKLIL